jgi:hypothetical protein
MTDKVKQERDPLLDKVVTLKFTIEQINAVLNLVGSELSYVKAAGIINEIQAQVSAQLVSEEKQNEQ